MERKLITSKNRNLMIGDSSTNIIDVFRIPQIYQQYYDLSEYEYIRKEVEEFISGGYAFFGLGGYP